MLYRPIWTILLFIFRVFFKRYYTNGYENIIKDKPIIFIGNHVNAFLDPLILPTLFWKAIYFIVRGDIFNTPLKRWLLWQTHQMPMYRQRDGKSNLNKNDATFDKAYDLLSKNNTIIIFSEGDCVQEKHLRSIKKGTARMAFGAVKKYGWEIDVHLIPTTENYTHPSQFRSEVMINIGKPIKLLDYKKLYEEDEAKAMNQLTKDIQVAMIDVYIHIENRADLNLFEQLIEVERNNNPEQLLPWKKKNKNRFNREKRVANLINSTRLENEGELEKVKQLADVYHKGIKKLKLNDSYFGNFKPNVVMGFLLGVVLFPVFIVGYIFNIGQYKLADFVATKKIKLIHFKNSIRLGIILLINTILLLVIMLCLAFQNLLLAIAIPFIATALAWITVTYKEQLQTVFAYVEQKKVQKNNKTKFNELRGIRNKLVDFMNQ